MNLYKIVYITHYKDGTYINRKKNKFTIRYTNQYDPWGFHFINKN